MTNVLICDDERDIVSTLNVYLTGAGYRTSLAVRAKAGVFWKNTVPYRALRFCGSFAGRALSNFPLYWKTLTAFAALAMIELPLLSVGSGLGLSIAKSLANLQGAALSVRIDGDLFKVIPRFPGSGGERA